MQYLIAALGTSSSQDGSSTWPSAAVESSSLDDRCGAVILDYTLHNMEFVHWKSRF